MITPLADRGEYSLTLKNRDGSDRVLKLVFNFQSMDRMEERLGYGLTKLAAEVSKMNIRMRPIVEIIYEGFMEGASDKEKRSFSQEKLQQLILDNGIPQVARALMTSLMKILVAGKDEVPAGEGVPAKVEIDGPTG